MKYQHQQALLFLASVGLGAVIAVIAVGGYVSATTYIPPTANPPEGNMPSTIWNILDLSDKQPQVDAAIMIDGGGPAEDGTGNDLNLPIGLSVGTANLDLGPNNPSENVIYGVADEDTMLADPVKGYDYLMLLQTYSPTTSTYYDRLSVDKFGNTRVSGNLITEKQLKSTGCFGPVFVGLTSVKYKGNLDGITLGYGAANAKCANDFQGDAHVCTSSEMLNSIKCALATDPIKNASLDGRGAWVNAGPPGYTASSNDCEGWTVGKGYDSATGATYYGRTWKFDHNTGGTGFVATCNGATNFACCK